MKQEYIDRIKDAELVLIGVGKEFEEARFQKTARACEAIQTLARVLEGKNYFIITTCTNDILHSMHLKDDRVVSPCGTLTKKQCPEHCEGSLAEMTNEDMLKLEKAIENNREPDLGVCKQCGKPLVLNNVYANHYDEEGYLTEWSRYTKWLQGTLNKKLCILELGVDLAFPSIIRWPFEKVGFYNQKSVFIRVNEKLYHMSEELKDKGISISQNSIDWLLDKDM